MNLRWRQEPFMPRWVLEDESGKSWCKVDAPGWPDPSFWLESVPLQVRHTALDAFTPQEAMHEALEFLESHVMQKVRHLESLDFSLRLMLNKEQSGVTK